jgi:hypothetical protein
MAAQNDEAKQEGQNQGQVYNYTPSPANEYGGTITFQSNGQIFAPIQPSTDQAKFTVFFF